MRISRIAVFLAVAFALAGCTPKDGANTNASPAANTAPAADAPKDNSDEFALLVRLPIEPEDVVWKETAVDPNTSPDATLTKRLIAVMRFTPENSSKLASEIARLHPPVAESVDPETWYPAELIAQGNVSGDGKLSGQSYAADEFLQPPYSQGKLTHIDNTDYFILELFGH